MDLLRSITGRVLIVGHRGAAAYAPENTLASFERARELGVDMVEFDVHLTADDRCVVIHDETVDRTTDGHGLVGAKTFAELRELDAGDGQRIPSLEEVLGWAGDVDMPLSVELKHPNVCTNRPYEGLEEAVLGLLDRFGLLARCFVHSYHHAAARRAKELRPDVTTAISCDYADFVDLAAVARAALADGIHLEWRSTSADAVAAAHAAGIHILGGGIPAGRDDIIRALIRNGVDMIDSDDPDHLRAVVEDELARRDA
ncbi:MAG TPA: glycerophosphodiester phosphodiesterase family protein [Candidatus Limnocylindrales bacterium]|nr:glycerophosphodiester phosphodiesterase family protein [Candidatus Limnocylindrales bacterium]